MLTLGLCSLWMISQAGQWTQTPSATRLQPIKWNAHFGITFNFWWSAGLVYGLEPHSPPLSSQKNEMLIFGLHSTSDDWPSWLIDSNLIHHPSPDKKNEILIFGLRSLLMIGWASWWTWTPSGTPLLPKKWNAHFLIMFNFWWSAWLVNGLKPHPPPLSSQKNEILIFYYVQLLMLARLVNGLKPHPPLLSSQKNEMLTFGLRSTSDDQPGWSMDSNPICHPSQAKKMKCSFLYYIQLLMLARLVNEIEPHLPSLSSQKNEMLIFGLRWTSDDQPGWSMDSNPICHPSPAKKMKCLFLDYIQLLMIGRAAWWNQTSSTTPLLPEKWNAHFWIAFTSDDRLG